MNHRAARWSSSKLAGVQPLHVALPASLLLHAGLLVQWWQRPPAKQLTVKWGDKPGQFQVQLVLPPPAPPQTAPPPQPPQPDSRDRPETRSQSRSQPSRPALAAPPVLAMNQPRPDAARVLPPSTPSVSSPAQASPAQPDMNAMVEERRRLREATAAPLTPPPTVPVEDDIERRNRIVAANLAVNQQAFGNEPRQGGGVFTLRHVYQNDAAFIFYGWRSETGRKAPQLIELRRGDNPDMRIAVIRRMIVIIREHETGNFTWQSPRSGGAVILSAALSDNAALEAYLMSEFFGGAAARQ